MSHSDENQPVQIGGHAGMNAVVDNTNNRDNRPFYGPGPEFDEDEIDLAELLGVLI